MKMRLFLLHWAIGCFLACGAHAQIVNVTVSVTSPYSLLAKNYIQQGDNVVLTLRNTSASVQSIRVYTSIEGINNGVAIFFATNYIASIQSIILAPGETKIISLNQLKLFNRAPASSDLRFSKFNNRDYFNNGLLPEGLYRICAHILYDSLPQNETLGCATFWIRGYDPPIILNPQHNTAVRALEPQNVLFNWTPAGVPGKTMYRFKLVDLNLTPVKNPNDAFNNKSIPFYREEHIIASSLVYDNTKPALIAGHKYALQVEAYDLAGKQLHKNGGNSQVIVFIYEKKGTAAGAVDRVKEEAPTKE